MQIVQSGESVEIIDVVDFDINQIFTSGQTFRFYPVDKNTWQGISFGRLINIIQGEGKLTLSPCSLNEFEQIWYHFFDFGTDYTQIKNKLVEMDKRFVDMIAVGEGIRVLRQDPWEMLITFIISANNNIPRITKAVDAICTKYGNKIYVDDEFIGYDFPTPEALAEADVADIRDCGVGYRDKYIKKTAQMVVASGMPMFDDESGKYIYDLSSENKQILLNELLKFPGVGNKVADCIRLFGYGCHDAFPVDTWIRKAQIELEGNFKNDDEVRSHALNIYGELSGIAQQYLFYYIRYINAKKS